MIDLDSSDGGASWTSSSVGERPRSVKYRIRIHAANLPRLRHRTYPDTFAAVFTVDQKARSQYTLSPPSSSASSIDFTDDDYPPSTAPSPTVINSTALPGTLLGKTEVIRNCRNPDWTETITVDYEHRTDLEIYILVFQCHGETNCIGRGLFRIGDILGLPHRTKAKRMKKGGCIFCRLDRVVEDSEGRPPPTVRLKFSAKDLLVTRRKLQINRSFGNLFHHEPDTILQISRQPNCEKRRSWVTVYRSPIVINSLSPLWDTIELDKEILCNENNNRPLRFSVLVVHNNGQMTLVGITETTLPHLLKAGESALNLRSNLSNTSLHHADSTNATDYPELVLQRDVSKPQEVGRLQIRLAELQHVSGAPSCCEGRSETFSEHYDLAKASPPLTIELKKSFQDYINMGCELNLCVAIDYTSSNGDPREDGTYHFQSEDTLNDYEETILGIGNAVGAYSRNPMFSVWGFGAKFGDGQVRHIFQCGPDPVVSDVPGILDAYKSVFEGGVTMSGPTSFISVLQAAAARANKQHTEMTREKLRYTVLLVITDGVMDNFEETQRKLAVYSKVPLSIIFVGIGRSDFTSMHKLCSNHADGTRSNATFVEFRRHQHSPSALGQAALSKLPTQLCDYMSGHNL